VDRTARYSIEATRKAALGLHKRLIEGQRLAYEREHGRVGTPAEMLKLVAYDPSFAWLRPLSQLVMALDEVLANPELSESEAAKVRADCERMFIEPGFETPYLALLQKNPDVVVAHAQLQRELATLPRAAADA
jgi:hypothetical protein